MPSSPPAPASGPAPPSAVPAPATLTLPAAPVAPPLDAPPGATETAPAAALLPPILTPLDPPVLELVLPATLPAASELPHGRSGWGLRQLLLQLVLLTATTSSGNSASPQRTQDLMTSE
jgi:hypothetical protein